MNEMTRYKIVKYSLITILLIGVGLTIIQFIIDVQNLNTSNIAAIRLAAVILGRYFIFIIGILGSYKDNRASLLILATILASLCIIVPIVADKTITLAILLINIVFMAITSALAIYQSELIRLGKMST